MVSDKEEGTAVIQSVIRGLIARTINGIRGYFVWLRVGWPFAVLVSIVLAAAFLILDKWLHVWVVLILGTVLTVTEMLNYAIERLCDRCMGTRYNEDVRLIKDICAGAVLVAGLSLGAVGLWIVLA